jgi:CubicO group peptidase (beta-lactamase class C family)
MTAGGKTLNYACGWQVNTATQRVNSKMPVGSFGHGGAFATNGCIDPQSKIVTVYLVQNVLVPDSGRPKDVFQDLVMSAAGIKVEPLQSLKKKEP